MSLIFMDGFDDGLHGFKWNWGAGLVAGRSGNAMRLLTGNVYQSTHIFDVGETTLGWGFAYKVYGVQNCQFMNISNSGLQGLVLAQTSSNALSISRGQQFSTQTTLGTTANNVLTPGVFQYIEVFAVMHASAGSVEIRINGVTVLNLTGINTGAVTIDRISFFVSFPSYNTDIDDLYVINGSGTVNNTFLGDCTVQTLYPNGNGNYSQWVGSDADSVDNYLLVDETTPNTTDYVESGTAGNKDSYTFADLSAGVIGVRGVAVRSYAAKSDTGPQQFRNFARVGGTDYAGASRAPNVTPSYAPFSDIYEVNPATSALWTPTELNGAEFGVEAL